MTGHSHSHSHSHSPASHSRALVVADGDVDERELAGLAVSRGTESPERPLVLAADGGAARCLSAGVRPDLVVGDFDSLATTERQRLEQLGVELRPAAADKDESDMELCLLAALEAGARQVTVLGALGIERPEHSIANLLLLADARLDAVAVALVGSGSRISRIGTADGPGEAVITGRGGDFVSLFPLDVAVEGVSTEGLRFPLRGEVLQLGPSRGLSNELLGATGRVTCTRGRLLVVQTAKSDPEG
jgi:thiamine pyrophosphokinase